MKRIIGTFVTLAALAAASSVALAQALAPAKPEEVGLSSQRLEKIGAVLKQDIADGKLPGAVVMVARKGRLAYSEAFGFLDKQKETTMPKDAVFRIYSMTKPLASVVAMMLVEDGRIQLTDPVA